MLSRPQTSGERGSVVVVAVFALIILLALGMALLAIVDTQSQASGTERTRDQAFNLADSAMSSAGFSLSRAWPASPTSAPSNTGSVGSSAQCSVAPFGAQLGAATAPGSATAKLQPNLNASYTDAAYVGATWQVSVCDDDPTAAGPTIWKEALLTRQNYDQNQNNLVWVRAQATVASRTRVLASLVRITTVPALSSKYGLIAGRWNSDVTNTLGAVLGGGLLGNLAQNLLQTDPLVATDPAANTTPPSSGVVAVRCGALNSLPNPCLGGVVGSTDALPYLNTLLTGNKLVQATSPTATSEAGIAQLKQQAMASGTYVGTSPSTVSYPSNFTSWDPPLCTLPAGAGPTTVVYIEQVGNGDQACKIDTTTNPQFKALVVGRGRIVLRGNNTAASGGTFSGVVYALNQQRDTLGDSASTPREVIRIDRGAHVRGGVAADGKSGQVGIYPPPACDPNSLLGLGCSLSAVTSILGVLDTYNPAIQSNVALINALQIYDTAFIVPGSYRDISGEMR